MTTLTPLHQALLELGLEDLIPLPETLGDRDVHDAVNGEPSIDQIGAALIDLLHLRRISVWMGPWADEPERVEPETAEPLLRDVRRYAFDSENDGSARVYFVNVENVA